MLGCAELEPLIGSDLDLEPLTSDVLTADGGGIVPPAKRQCTNSMKENRCSECGVPNKFTPKSGHTQKGWCRERQRFTTRSSGKNKGAGERLRDLEQNPEQAEHFLAAVRQGDAEQVRQKLMECPELILVAAPGAAKRDPSRTMWSWSPLHAALHLVTPEADGADPIVQVVAALLLHCKKSHILLTTLKRKSDSFASPLHEAAYRGEYQLVLLDLVASCYSPRSTYIQHLGCEYVSRQPSLHRDAPRCARRGGPAVRKDSLRLDVRLYV